MGSLTVLRRRAHLVVVDGRPVYDRARPTCAHDLHVVHDGQRLGLHVHRNGKVAYLYRCDTTNKDGC